jgi:hypothetical protein
LAGAAVLVVLEGWVLEDALILAGLVVAVAAASRASAVRAGLPAGSPLKRPVLFYNRSPVAGRRNGSMSRARPALAGLSRSSCTSGTTSAHRCPQAALNGRVRGVADIDGHRFARAGASAR